MDSTIINQSKFASYLRNLVGSNCSIGLHEVGLNIPNRTRDETAQVIMKEGLNNKRGGSTYFSVTYYGKVGNDSEISFYDYYGTINDKVVVVVAIPETFKMGNGSLVYGGYFNKRGRRDDLGHAECISDYVFSSKIPPEFILGYYTYSKKDVKPIYKTETISRYDSSTGQYSRKIVRKAAGYQYGDAVFHHNPRYYSRLSQQEKDDLIYKLFENENFFDINDDKSIKAFYDFNKYYVTTDDEESYTSKTIKQYEHSSYYEKKKELEKMTEKVVIPGFKVISKT